MEKNKRITSCTVTSMASMLNSKSCKNLSVSRQAVIFFYVKVAINTLKNIDKICYSSATGRFYLLNFNMFGSLLL